MALKHLVAGAACFAAGVMTSNALRHTAANFIADTSVPRVEVSYTKRGTFVNGERVYDNRLGDARCDWNGLSLLEQSDLVLEHLQTNRQTLTEYLHQAPDEDQQHLAYASLVQLASRNGSSVRVETERMRDAVGFRWDFAYVGR